MKTDRPQTSAARGIPCLAALLLAMVLAGCSPFSYLGPNRLPYAKLALPYNRTQVKTSTTLDVLNFARDPNYQFDREKAEQVLLTQSETAVGYSGRSRDGRKTWLNLIVFDEFRMTATRKYFFAVDEKAKTTPTEPQHLVIPPRKGMVLDSEFIIDPEILTMPYATDEAQKVAIIRWLAEQVKNDTASLVGSPKNPARGGEAILLCGMMINQIFQGVLTELAKSPGLAQNLDRERGIGFPHPSLDEGRIRMVVDNGVAVLKVRVNLPMAPRRRPPASPPSS